LTDAHRKDLEDKLWSQYLVDRANMNPSNFETFEEYKGKMLVVPKKTIKLNKAKILAGAERIKAMDQKGGK